MLVFMSYPHLNSEYLMSSIEADWDYSDEFSLSPSEIRDFLNMYDGCAFQ